MDEAPTNENEFNHPYTPYGVQSTFMRAVYKVLQTGDGQVGIMESPTGTGKSLSLICACLTWLRRHKAQQYEASIQLSEADTRGEPKWMIEHLLTRKRDDLLSQWQDRERRLESIRAKEKVMEERGNKRRRVERKVLDENELIDDEARWLLDDMSEAKEENANTLAGLIVGERDTAVSRGLGLQEEEEEIDPLDGQVKIFYASRTHSQLSQFVSELRRPLFPSSLPDSVKQISSVETEAVKHVPLSSRQKLCINPEVASLGSLSAINDRCTELQQSQGAARCPHLPNDENLKQTRQLRDAALATLPDIEDLHRLGQSLSVCPYYASRTALAAAEIVTLPYPLLLQKSAREALNIRLEGNIVVIDEAHNIMDAITNVYSADIRLSELTLARQMLAVYVKRFGNKLKPENRNFVAQIGKILSGLSEWLQSAMKRDAERGIVDSVSLLMSRGIDQINMFRLIRFIHGTRLAYKIESYVSHVENDSKTQSRRRTSSPVLHTLVSFITALTNLSTEGRIFFQKLSEAEPDIQLSYLLLSPTHAFSSIASSARAVILAGGTMSPFEDYTAHLFPQHHPDKVTTLNCGHVVPSSSLFVWTLSWVRRNHPPVFDFSYQRRNDHAMILQLGSTLLNMSSVIPDGVVVFLPSYDYLDQVVSIWEEVSDPGKPSIWDRLQMKKRVFCDKKGYSSEEILRTYSEAILVEDPVSSPPQQGSKGAILFSVVGGKMSEGINFSDSLGRCVVVVGLPFPNINSPEWQAKMEYLEVTALARTVAGETSTQAAARAKQAARDYYENSCMRAVNQSVGRAIRHRGDYAAIVLIDRRYGQPRIRSKLSGWIGSAVRAGSEERGLTEMLGGMGAFFRSFEQDSRQKA